MTPPAPLLPAPSANKEPTMCGLCSDDAEERQRARRFNRHMAESLRRLASVYEHMASGAVKPHSDEAKDAGYLARGLIRALVEEWV